MYKDLFAGTAEHISMKTTKEVIKQPRPSPTKSRLRQRRHSRKSNPQMSDSPWPTKSSSLRPSTTFGELTTRPTYHETVTKDTASNKTAPSPTIKKRTGTTGATNSTRATTVNPPEEPRRARMDKAELIETRDPHTMVPYHNVALHQVLYIPVPRPNTSDTLPPHVKDRRQSDA